MNQTASQTTQKSNLLKRLGKGVMAIVMAPLKLKAFLVKTTQTTTGFTAFLLNCLWRIHNFMRTLFLPMRWLLSKVYFYLQPKAMKKGNWFFKVLFILFSVAVFGAMFYLIIKYKLIGLVVVIYGFEI